MRTALLTGAFGLVATLAWTAAQAAVIDGSSNGLASPTSTITFDDSNAPAQGVLVNTQFSSDGATFSGLSLDTGTLGQTGATGFSGNSLAGTNGSTSLVISFNQSVSAADLALFYGPDAETLTAYLGGTNGTVVASFALPSAPGTQSAQYAAAESLISQLQSELSAASSAVSSDQQQLAALQSEYSSMSSQLTAVQAQASGLQQQIAALEAQAPLDDQQQAELAAMQSQYAAIESQVSSLQGQLSSVGSELSAVQQQETQNANAASSFNEQLGSEESTLSSIADSPTGIGYVGFDDLDFDTLVLTTDGSSTTAIDSVDFIDAQQVPEPSTALLLGGFILPLLRRPRRV